jgi:3-phytase
MSRRLLPLLLLVACAPAESPSSDAPITAALPLVTDTLNPTVITETVVVDSDDPAIWLHPTDATQSFVLGTDKGDSTGGVYLFDLDGRIDRTRTVTPLMRMNNVDIAQDVAMTGGRMDVAVATERNRQRIRVFSLPDMRPIDGGGIVVFDGDTARAPMGVSLYRRPSDGALFAIVGGKTGPTDGTYLWQYRLNTGADGLVRGTKVRAFGAYSGRKEIEAIAVDHTLGYVYYSDEQVGVRKYFAEPDSGNAELALFATSGFADDHEGIAIYERDARTGYLVVSDQGANRIQLFAREGSATNPHEHTPLAVIPVRATETDGLEVTSRAVGDRYPAGLLVMMSNPGAFHYYDWRDVQRAIDKAAAGRP